MKKLTFLMLLVAALFVVTLPSCRDDKGDGPIEEQPPGGTTTEQTGTIKVTAKTGPLTTKANATVSMAGTKDSMLQRKFRNENIQSTNGSGVATFSGLKLNKEYFFYAEYTEAGQFFTGDTSGVVKVPNAPANIVIMMKN